MFYDVPISYVKEELRFRCELEPFSARNANSIRLKCQSTSQGRLQLTSRLCSYLDFMLKGEFYCLCCMCVGLSLAHGYLAINLALILQD